MSTDTGPPATVGGRYTRDENLRGTPDEVEYWLPASEVEHLLDPLRRVPHSMEVGVAQDRQVGGDRHALARPD